MKTRDLTLNALFIALTVVMAIVPNLGVIQIGVISITILHIPVIIAGLVLGFRAALINAFAFGVASMFVAISRGSGILDPLFVNPLVSVVPRLLFGLAIGVIYAGMKKISKNQTVIDAVTAVVSTLIHSVLVLSALFIASIGNPAFFELANTTPKLFLLFQGIFISNALFEVAAALIIALPVANVLRRLNRGHA